jgi:hypothetical protein
MRVWLHEWTGDEWGWNAWSLDHLGFATWAPSRSEVLNRVPGKLMEYREWLVRHGMQAPDVDMDKITIVEEISGNEVAFAYDLAPAAPDEITHCLELLKCSRQDLIEAVKDLPAAVLDWDPPYRWFPEWARWRTIRQILEHVASTEVGYYLPKVGYSGLTPNNLAGIPWSEQLRLSRAETEQFLVALSAVDDRERIAKNDAVWSVRKVLRRLVRHELLHWKSIRRIIRDYNKQAPSASGCA